MKLKTPISLLLLLVSSGCTDGVLNHRAPSSEFPWERVSDEDSIATYKSSLPENGILAFRGETVIDSSVPQIAAVLNDPTLRKEWVDSLLESRVIESKSLIERIEYNRMSVPWPFKDRDFVYQVSVKVSKQPASITIGLKSVEDLRAPVVPGIVRGEILHSQYEMKELQKDPPKTSVSVEMAVDPKGVIAPWLVNLTQRNWAKNTLLKIRKYATREDGVVPKDIQDYFKD